MRRCGTAVFVTALLSVFSMLDLPALPAEPVL
jgi:hypothetical protein